MHNSLRLAQVIGKQSNEEIDVTSVNGSPSRRLY